MSEIPQLNWRRAESADGPLSVEPIDRMRMERSNLRLDDQIEDLINGVDRVFVEEGIEFGLTRTAAKQVHLAVSGIISAFFFDAVETMLALQERR